MTLKNKKERSKKGPFSHPPVAQCDPDYLFLTLWPDSSLFNSLRARVAD